MMCMCAVNVEFDLFKAFVYFNNKYHVRFVLFIKDMIPSVTRNVFWATTPVLLVAAPLRLTLFSLVHNAGRYRDRDPLCARRGTARPRSHCHQGRPYRTHTFTDTQTTTLTNKDRHWYTSITNSLIVEELSLIQLFLWNLQLSCSNASFIM